MNESNSNEPNRVPDYCSRGRLMQNASTFEKLQNAIEKSIKRISSKTRVLPYFKEHFQEVYRTDSKNVLELYKSMMNQLESVLKEEIQLQLSANNVGELLDSLDKIKRWSNEWTSLHRHWRPTGNPKENIKAHLKNSLEYELQQLETVLNTLESQNRLLNDCVVKSDERLLQSIKIIEDYCLCCSEAASVMSTEVRRVLLDVNINLPVPRNIP